MLKPDTAFQKDRTQPSGNKMEHRHFATIADILRRMKETGFTYSTNEVINIFADELRATNPRFDRARFLRACGV